MFKLAQAESLCHLAVFTLIAANCLGAQTLRVCADPNNLPFSNRRGEGIENRVAEMMARDVGAKLEYAWWPERGSLVRNTLEAGRCDVLMGLPSDMPEVATTVAYYQSSYVFVTPRGLTPPIRSLDDPRLASLRIGVHVTGDDYAPPAMALARRGLAANLKGYSLFGAAGETNAPARLIDAVVRGEVDIAIVWGPFGGYFAKHATAALDVTPVSPAAYLGVPFAYSISAGVREDHTALRDALNGALGKERAAIQSLLAEYAFPLVDSSRKESGCASSPHSSASLR